MRYYVYEIFLDKNIYQELDNSKYYVGKHQTECKDLINDGYYGSGTLLNSVYNKYGFAGVSKRILKECKTLKDVLLYEKFFIQQCKLKNGDNCINLQVSSKKIEIYYDENNIESIRYEKIQKPSNFIWITNGILNKKLYENDKMPDGFEPGFIIKEETLIKKDELKNKKKQEKTHLKNLPLKERKVIKSILDDKKFKYKQARDFIRNHKINNSLIVKIEGALKNGLSVDDIFNILKYNHDDLDTILYTKILEMSIFFQTWKMPKFLETNMDSLKNLYKENPILKEERDIEKYFIKSYLMARYEF